MSKHQAAEETFTTNPAGGEDNGDRLWAAAQHTGYPQLLIKMAMKQMLNEVLAHIDMLCAVHCMLAVTHGSRYMKAEVPQTPFLPHLLLCDVRAVFPGPTLPGGKPGLLGCILP
jgi:hypothetical protein